MLKVEVANKRKFKPFVRKSVLPIATIALLFAKTYDFVDGNLFTDQDTTFDKFCFWFTNAFMYGAALLVLIASLSI